MTRRQCNSCGVWKDNAPPLDFAETAEWSCHACDPENTWNRSHPINSTVGSPEKFLANHGYTMEYIQANAVIHHINAMRYAVIRSGIQVYEGTHAGIWQWIRTGATFRPKAQPRGTATRTLPKKPKVKKGRLLRRSLQGLSAFDNVDNEDPTVDWMDDHGYMGY